MQRFQISPKISVHVDSLASLQFSQIPKVQTKEK